MNLDAQLQLILNALAAKNATPLLVGGCVRDDLMGLDPKDHDVEVFGIGPNELQEVLGEFGRVDAVGKSFGVLKLGKYDFALPRRENKRGLGHTGFMVEVDPTMTIEEACARRDFTINSIAYNPLTNQYLDPCNGRQDIVAKILRPTSNAFMEDPLRVLRGFQFAARFDMKPAPELLYMCDVVKPEYTTLALERIWGEWYKWAEKGLYPARGLDFLLATGWLDLYPQLNSLRFCEQDARWHPEGDAWYHTKHVVNAMSEICVREGIVGEDRAVLMFAALGHDIAKPKTTVANEQGRIVSPGHCELGAEMVKDFMKSIGGLDRMIEQISPLIREHLVHIRKEMNFRIVRRLALRLHPANLKQLAILVEADHSGRPPLPKGLPKEMSALMEMSEAVNVANNKPQPLVMGRDLIPLGFEPGKYLGVVLKQAFEAQLDGVFETKEDGVNWVLVNFLGELKMEEK